MKYVKTAIGLFLIIIALYIIGLLYRAIEACIELNALFLIDIPFQITFSIVSILFLVIGFYLIRKEAKENGHNTTQ